MSTFKWYSMLVLLCWCTLCSSFSCEYFNATCIREGKSSSSCMGEQKCEDAQEHLCYVVWSPGNANSSNIVHHSGHEVHLMGCMPSDNSHRCEHSQKCIEVNEERFPFFCCCSNHMCNANFVLNATRTTTTPTSITKAIDSKKEPDDSDSLSLNAWLIIALIFFLVIFIIALLLLLVLCVRSKRLKRYGSFGEVGQNEQNNDSGRNFGAVTRLIDKEIHKEGLICGKGQFGVYKGRVVGTNESVAIKIFNIQQRASWIAEQEVYNLPRMSHEGILHFVGIDARNGDLGQPELWLITQYHERGSLCDFLHNETLSFLDLCHLAHSMMSGLAYLHEELPQRDMLDLKPAVAHRDFKSKNVLIKSDMTACICDFGLALIFEPGKACGDEYGQVGTPRYMAPEMLEGSIYFTRESFLRIDMYACGLVLWELATRCLEPNLEPPLEYKLPFQDLEEHPTLEQMLNLVVNRQERPSLNPSWESGNHLGMSDLSQTITQCWDQDSEARLSASNVRQRMHNLLQWAIQNQSGGENPDYNPDGLLVQQANHGDGNIEAEQIEMTPLISETIALPST